MKYHSLPSLLFFCLFSACSGGQLNSQYFFLEDIYVSKTDALLPAGTYTVTNFGLPFTASPCKKDTTDNEIYQQGAYISYLENNFINFTIKFITSGSFVVRVQENCV